MAPLKIKKVTSFSSEDPLFPAGNLLEKGKWKCKEEGEKQAWVLLQLEETSVITNIDIGNAGAAFIEVQVGRLGTDTDNMKVMLVASSFMSVNEARVGQNMGRVRMFGLDKLAAEVAKEKWDLVKVVVTQPFTKQSKYGISFIALSGPSISTSAKVVAIASPAQPALGAFKLKCDPPEKDIAVGSYFAKQKIVASPVSVAASLRVDTTVADLALQQARREETKRKREVELTPAMKKEVKKRRVERALPSRNSLPGESEEEERDNIYKERNKGKDKAEPEKKKKANIEKDIEIHENKEIIAKPVQSKPRKFAPFSDLLKGVVFTISGFQNPLRGQIRQKALEMGAKYTGDWNNSCTHLICAFANTPKFNQVVGKGTIVKKEWVEECHTQRKRLPWRRFCLDRRDEGKEESEEETWEQGDDCDTDEEIEKIKMEEQREKEQKIKHSTASSSKTTDPYECDTDEEIEKIKYEELVEKEKLAKQVKKKKLEEERSTEKQEYASNAYDCDTDSENDELATNGNNSIDPYDVETDIDDEEIVKLLPKTSKLILGCLPDFFKRLKFYLHGNFQPDERKLVERYIVGCGGKVEQYMREEVKVVITHNSWEAMFEDARSVSSMVEFVRPEWVFKCTDEGKLIEFGDFLVDAGK